MSPENKEKYIQAYSKVFGVVAEEVRAYAEKKGMAALTDDVATIDLLSSKKQQEKLKAFQSLVRLGYELEIESPRIGSPQDIANFAHSVMEKIRVQESIVVLSLNTKNRILDYDVISLGSVNYSLAHVRDIFRNAISNNAFAIAMVHNHPSGNVEPSQEDIDLTKKVVSSGEIVGIRVLDHVVVSGLSPKNYTSMHDKCLMEASVSYGENEEDWNQEEEWEDEWER